MVYSYYIGLSTLTHSGKYYFITTPSCSCSHSAWVTFFDFIFFDLFIYPEESRYMMNGFRLSPAVGLAFP